ncbi:DUF2933 domain-containing protein [Asticcacaulis sp. AC460]|uniref:DUF2933 domain-containing protein n=1 Tax=Asticcacaulis sp. AC460 TaxID=1282360 RepID=UPI0009DF3EFE|nr:DUF2933 domain-containing protein [Asticcacaulis sp. AC460]
MKAQHDSQTGGSLKSWLFSRTGAATLLCLAVLGFLIYKGHGLHLLGFLPWLLILACPLMHIFMHGGHHGGHHPHSNEESPGELKAVAPADGTSTEHQPRSDPHHKHEGH